MLFILQRKENATLAKEISFERETVFGERALRGTSGPAAAEGKSGGGRVQPTATARSPMWATRAKIYWYSEKTMNGGQTRYGFYCYVCQLLLNFSSGCSTFLTSPVPCFTCSLNFQNWLCSLIANVLCFVGLPMTKISHKLREHIGHEWMFFFDWLIVRHSCLKYGHFFFNNSLPFPFLGHIFPNRLMHIILSLLCNFSGRFKECLHPHWCYVQWAGRSRPRGTTPPVEVGRGQTIQIQWGN